MLYIFFTFFTPLAALWLFRDLSVSCPTPVTVNLYIPGDRSIHENISFDRRSPNGGRFWQKMSARHENLQGLELPTETKWRWVKVLLGGNISLGGYRDSKSHVSGVCGYPSQIPTTWHDPHRSKNVIPYLGAMGPSHLLLFQCIFCFWFYSKLGWFQGVIAPNPKFTRHPSAAAGPVK